MFLRVGQTFAGFRILQILGSGGMGEVYLAEHPRLPRRDALKLLRTDISADADYRGRFEREANLASTLWHQHIVGLHDRGEAEGRLWISMDFVDGRSAAELLADRYPGGMPVDLVVAIVSAVGSALDYAHKQGLLHRDVKPANIMVSHADDEGELRVLLTDFGIARSIDDISGLTTTNMTVGTVAYAAPEQLMGEDIDGRADQYALAATAYHLLSGAQLYPNSNPAVVISRHLNAPPPKLADTRPDLGRLDEVLAVGLSKDPADRFAKCSDFVRALAGKEVEAVSGTAPTQSANVPHRKTGSTRQTDSSPRRRWLIPALASVLVLAVAGAMLFWRPWSIDEQRPTSNTAAAAPNTGPLTGNYAADFGPELQLSDGKVLDSATAQGAFDIRSECIPTGCTALGQATGGPIINRQIVFDDEGGQWISTGTAPSTSPAISTGMKAGCEQGLSPEVWESLVLKLQPDGTFAGQYVVANANNCNTSRTLRLRRIGDTDVGKIADPASLPPLVQSPAAGFRGQYRYTYSRPSTNGSHAVVGEVQTYCLRTGDRCFSYFNEPQSAEPFLFIDGRWTLHYEAPVSCGSATGPRVQIDRSAELELPQPAADPIDVITGTGQEQVNDPQCAIPPQIFGLRFERLGD